MQPGMLKVKGFHVCSLLLGNASPIRSAGWIKGCTDVGENKYNQIVGVVDIEQVCHG